ncbi:dTDP-4-dehydrorhamnose reductase family protein [Cohnella abietis]|uniref:dTDP-4-dehydrorhamnose reductase n=1 Tax=Cohnella abietis TaxID=2507935 RepID=A0A3T1DA73_9BACL|nr:SDR family oxidoreductase [Cohnella abietis]BBI35007.1 NAD(P)-dependent oxidoreductase [Cohnella abietis]
MRIVLLGGNGMAGHMITAYLKRSTTHDIIVTVRPRSGVDGDWEVFEGIQARELDARSFEDVRALIEQTSPDIIINAVGILNHHAEDHPLDAYKVNGLLPHWLRHLADRVGARLIHISSDCVFSGARGNYVEDDIPDGSTVYARTKALGEILGSQHVTIRTSIIGPDKKPDGIGLLQWFLSQEGEISGYQKVFWNGVTTLELAKVIEWLLERPEVGGLVHLTAAETVSKHNLLLMLQGHFDKGNVTIIPEEEPIIDRTLTATRKDFEYRTPYYKEMLFELQQWMASS